MNIAEKTLQLKQDFDDVYEAGKKAERDEFWDIFQVNGTRTNYQYAFARQSFTDKTFYPKYDLICKSDGQGMFYNFSAGEPISLIQRFKECGIQFDVSNCVILHQTFSWATKITEIPVINTKGLTNRHLSRMTDLFAYCRNLVTVEKLIVEADIKYSGEFKECYALENITIEGTIGQNGFDVHWSTKLSADSLKSIINALSTTTTGLTITLPTTAQSNYEKVYGSGSWATLTATRSNWTIAYA